MDGEKKRLFAQDFLKHFELFFAKERYRGQTVDRPIGFVERPIRFVERPIGSVVPKMEPIADRSLEIEGETGKAALYICASLSL